MSQFPQDPALEEMLCFDLYAAQHAFGRLYKPLLDPLSLTYPQYLVMRSLWSRAPQSVGEIGSALRLETNTLTPILKRLEGQERVTRRRDPGDERRVIVDLTDEGRALSKRAGHVPQKIASAIGISADEARRLQTDLRTLVANMAQSTAKD